MKKELYVIEFSNAHWCGGPEYCVVWATDRDGAEEAAVDHMNGVQYELYQDHYEDENEEAVVGEDDTYCTIESIERLVDSEHAQYYGKDKHYYPCVNPEEAEEAEEDE